MKTQQERKVSKVMSIGIETSEEMAKRWAGMSVAQIDAEIAELETHMASRYPTQGAYLRGNRGLSQEASDRLDREMGMPRRQDALRLEDHGHTQILGAISAAEAERIQARRSRELRQDSAGQRSAARSYGPGLAQDEAERLDAVMGIRGRKPALRTEGSLQVLGAIDAKEAERIQARRAARGS